MNREQRIVKALTFYVCVSVVFILAIIACSCDDGNSRAEIQAESSIVTWKRQPNMELDTSGLVGDPVCQVHDARGLLIGECYLGKGWSLLDCWQWCDDREGGL